MDNYSLELLYSYFHAINTHIENLVKNETNLYLNNKVFRLIVNFNFSLFMINEINILNISKDKIFNSNKDIIINDLLNIKNCLKEEYYLDFMSNTLLFMKNYYSYLSYLLLILWIKRFRNSIFIILHLYLFSDEKLSVFKYISEDIIKEYDEYLNKIYLELMNLNLEYFYLISEKIIKNYFYLLNMVFTEYIKIIKKNNNDSNIYEYFEIEFYKVYLILCIYLKDIIKGIRYANYIKFNYIHRMIFDFINSYEENKEFLKYKVRVINENDNLIEIDYRLNSEEYTLIYTSKIYLNKFNLKSAHECSNRKNVLNLNLPSNFSNLFSIKPKDISRNNEKYYNFIFKDIVLSKDVIEIIEELSQLN